MKILIYDGLRFVRDDKTGYYLCSKKVNGNRPRLHRYIWEKYNGEIPKGYHVHHADHDKSNNEINNLILLKHGDHSSYHVNHLTNEQKDKRNKNALKNIESNMKSWHSTDEGHNWHKKQFEKSLKPYLEPTVKRVCEVCKKEFFTNIAIQEKVKFCSNNCKASSRRKSKVDNADRTCFICGKIYNVNKYSKSKTCSRKCRGEYRIRMNKK